MRRPLPNALDLDLASDRYDDLIDGSTLSPWDNTLRKVVRTMAKELKPLDTSSMPELLRIASEVAASEQPFVLRRDNEELAILSPVPKARKSIRARPVTKDAPHWNLIGIGESEGLGDVSRNKHTYLAEAYRHDG